MFKKAKQTSRSTSTTSKKKAPAKTTSKKTNASIKKNGSRAIVSTRATALSRKTNGSNRTSASSRATASKLNNNTMMAHRQKIENLYELLMTELNSLYVTENMIVDHLPAMVNKANNPKLKEALREHLKETRGQSTRLKKIFTILGEKQCSVKNYGMEGLLKEGVECISNTIRAATQDACIIACAQKIEHYEISSYGTARAHALQLKLQHVADLLKETLEEEIHADKMLTKIAEGSFFTDGINKKASEVEELANSKS